MPAKYKNKFDERAAKLMNCKHLGFPIPKREAELSEAEKKKRELKKLEKFELVEIILEKNK